MSIHQHATLEDTVYFWFAANDTSGSGGDGASPLADVRLAGAAAGAAPVLSPTPALLSHASYPAGCYEVAVAATAGNGFAATNTYAVFCTLAIDSQNPTGFVGSFTLDPIIANVKEVSDDSAAAADLELFIEALGTDDKVLISTDAQDLSATLDVNTKTITNGIIVAATLGADCITAAKIADDAISSEHLNTGALTADAFAADALVAATFATGAFTADAFAANALVAATFAADCITSAKIADDAISSEHINTGAFTADAFAADALVAATFATGALTADAFAADAIVAATFATGALTADAFAADALVAATFATDSIAADALAADALAEIKTQVDAALDTAISELGVAAPAATPTIRTGIMLMYMALRNKLVVQTSGTDAIEIYNNAGTKIAAKTITDDGSDYTEAEMA